MKKFLILCVFVLFISLPAVALAIPIPAPFLDQFLIENFSGAAEPEKTIPEPASMFLLGTGLLMLGTVARRKLKPTK